MLWKLVLNADRTEPSDVHAVPLHAEFCKNKFVSRFSSALGNLTCETNNPIQINAVFTLGRIMFRLITNETCFTV